MWLYRGVINRCAYPICHAASEFYGETCSGLALEFSLSACGSCRGATSCSRRGVACCRGGERKSLGRESVLFASYSLLLLFLVSFFYACRFLRGCEFYFGGCYASWGIGIVFSLVCWKNETKAETVRIVASVWIHRINDNILKIRCEV